MGDETGGRLFPSAVYRYQIEHGHIPDAIYDALGFPEDVDANGVVVPKTAGITLEHCQRAKCLSHLYQRKLCLNELMKQLGRCLMQGRRSESAGIKS